ncbi:MAG: hypothetical protein M3548_04315 [Actinomycetota bacterium]|nr:hypothetical protein [Actinomycetota bacterium]
MTAGPGYGYAPGYGYPPPMPPKKTKAPLIVGIVAAVILLGLGVTATLLYLDAHEDGGRPASGDTLAEECDRVSTETRAMMRTTNPHSGYTPNAGDGKNYVLCNWGQTEGVDGEGLRQLTLTMSEYTDEPEKAEEDYAQTLTSRRSAAQKPEAGDKTVVHKIDDIGDEAFLVEQFTGSAFFAVDLVFREDGHVITVGYQGWDVGVFTNTAPDPKQFAGLVDKAAREIENAL